MILREQTFVTHQHCISISRRKWYSYNGINGFSHGRHKRFKHLRLAYTYQSHFHSPQIYIRLEAAGFRLESSSFIRLVPLQKSYLREMQRCQDWISPLRVHRWMSMGSGLDRILRRVVMWMDCIAMQINRRYGRKDHRRCSYHSRQ